MEGSSNISEVVKPEPTDIPSSNEDEHNEVDSSQRPSVVIKSEPTDIPSSNEDEHNEVDSSQPSLVSVVYVGQEIWVTDFDKIGISKKIMERLSAIEACDVQDPALDDICAGKDPTDSRWYRVKVVSLQPAVTVHYIDFGNESEISPENLAVLPDELKLEPPLAKKAVLKWDNPCCPEVVPCAGDVLEVKYDGKEADGTLKFEVLAVKGISDHDECVSDEEKSDEHLSSETIVDIHRENGSSAVTEDRSDFESFPVSDELQGVEAASSLREEAHTTVQEILQKLDEELPKQDEVAMQTRREVEKTMQEIDNRLPLQEEVAIQTRKEVQKIMEGLDERLQKQQEAALTSMRQMMEKALSQSLNKIDKIQKDLHKLYATSKHQQQQQQQQQHQQQHQQQQQQQRTNNEADAAYQRNQYNRPITRNSSAPSHDFSPDKRQQSKFPHYGEEKMTGPSHHAVAPFGGNGLLDGGVGGASGGSAPMSPRSAMSRPDAMQNFGAMRDGNAVQNYSAMRDDNGMRDGNGGPYGQMATQDQGGNSRRSVSLRLKQAGDIQLVGSSDFKISSILSVNNLPEVFSSDYLCTLFGLYGNVVRAKLLFNQKGKALVEMADSAQAAATTRMLDGVQMFGQTIHVRPSTFDKLNISPTEIANNTAKDHTRLNSYQANSVRRFRKGFWDPVRLVPPSGTLRVSNILKTVPDEKVGAAFTEKGFEFKSIHFLQGSADKKTAFVVFSSTEEAFRALHELHNKELSDWMPMKISFGVRK